MRRPWLFLSPLRTGRGWAERRPRFLYAAPVPPHGGLSEWPMGADCKSVGLAYEVSNPSPATAGTTAPDLLLVGGRSHVRGRWVPARWPSPSARGGVRRGT